jgi:hypothetical protein
MIVRIIGDFHTTSGGSQSASQLARMLAADNQVILHPSHIINPMLGLSEVANISEGKALSALSASFDGSCDLLLVYAGQLVETIQGKKTMWKKLFKTAGRAVLVLNYTIGQSMESWFQSGFHKIGFLSSMLRDEWCVTTRRKRTETFVLAPPVDLTPFLTVTPDYQALIGARHSRPSKWPYETPELLKSWRSEVSEALTFKAMDASDRVRHELRSQSWFTSYSSSLVPTEEFLSGSSFYWYNLESGKSEQGPRTIVEAMAAGLPIIADAVGGINDRVTHSVGWLVQAPTEYAGVLKLCVDNPELLSTCGAAARARAIKHFDPTLWIPHLLGN